MQNIWNYISNLGISGDESQLDRRTIILSNKLNFVMLVSMLLLLAITIPIMLLTNDPISYGTLRVVFLLGFNFLNLAVAGFGFTKLSKFLLIFVTSGYFPAWTYFLWVCRGGELYLLPLCADLCFYYSPASPSSEE